MKNFHGRETKQLRWNKKNWEKTSLVKLRNSKCISFLTLFDKKRYVQLPGGIEQILASQLTAVNGLSLRYE